MEGRGGSYLLLLLLVLQASTLGSCQPSTFCLRTLSRWTCPADLPTFDQVDLQKYAGRWYEIGSNAYFKNLQEAGGTCVSAFYTPNDDGSIQVFNSQTRVLGDLGSSLVRGISVQAAGICQGAQQICSEIYTGSVSQGLSIVQEVAMNISQSYPEESSLLLESKSQIGEALMAIDLGLDSLSKSVSQIQILNSQLSQADGKAEDRVAELSEVAAKVNADIVDSIISSKLESIAAARRNLTALAGKLYNENQYTKAISQLLFRGVSLIQDLEETLPGHAAMIKATVAAAAESAASFAYEKNQGVGGFISIVGKAVVPNATAPGKLSVTFGTVPAAARYWILKVLDEKSDDYGAAIVYGCSDLPGGGTYQPLFILSRQPTISDDVSQQFFDYVQSLGIYSDCHQVFVPTSQPETCQYPSPQSS